MPHVVVYTSPTCTACRSVKEFLSRNHVEFEERSLSEPRWLEELGELHGAYSAPSVVVDGQLVENASLPAISQALGLELE